MGRALGLLPGALLVVFATLVAPVAEAQSTAGFPPAPPSQPTPAPRPPAPEPVPPSPRPYVAPPSYPPAYGSAPPPRSPAQYPPSQYPPAYGPSPAPYPPPQYSPVPYPPASAPSQYAPGYGPQPSAPPQYPPGYGPQPSAPQQYPPGYGQGPYGPYPPGYPPVAPPAPPNPLLDSQLRYRQVLGAYRRTDAGPALDARPTRTAFIRIVDETRRRHDGLYLRVAGGLGYGHDSMQADRAPTSTTPLPFQPLPVDGSGGSLGPVTEVAIGYTVGRGVALGAGVYTATIPSLVAKVTDPYTGSYHYRVSQLAILGPIADWYFHEDAGFHAQASPGVATYVAGAADSDVGTQAQAHTAVGFGFMLGIGYEWWIADQWSMGFLGRFIYGSTSGSDDRGVGWTHTGYAPALLLGATYN